MEAWLQKVKQSWNETSDSEWYRSLRTDEKIAALREKPESAFHPEVFRLIRKYVPKLLGKKVLLPSSGDNHAAFTFALLGAAVTSADISERQLENAAAVAAKLGLRIDFRCENTMELSGVESAAFDLVYTSNGTLSWIADLGGMYRNVCRVLKPSGIYVGFDVHPFNRPFSGEPWKQPQIVKPYSDVFPLCHWRVQDILNAGIAAGLALKEAAELQAADASFWYTYYDLAKRKPAELENINDFAHNPMAALPAWLALVYGKAAQS